MQLPAGEAVSAIGAPLFKGDFVVDIDIHLYPRSVIVRACYALADRFDVFLEPAPSNAIRIHVKAHEGIASEQLRAILAEALVDFALREIIEARTAKIRDIIVRTALAEAMPQGHADTGSR